MKSGSAPCDDQAGETEQWPHKQRRDEPGGDDPQLLGSASRLASSGP
jgi:hypothetical protein